MFDPRDPYERYYWHYESRRPLSLAQIIALGSVDAETVGLIWLLLEHGASLIVAGPTDPQPGVGKTTTLNALLQFLPEGTAFAYMSGMYEDFAFTHLPDIQPATTYALCNEVSNHLSIYMWGRIARRYLALPTQGFHIATSVHADTLEEMLSTFQRDLHLSTRELRHLGLIVNIGLVGHTYPARRRWFTTHFMQLEADPARPNDAHPIPLSLWNSFDDTFEHADAKILSDLARWSGLTVDEFQSTLTRRVRYLQELSQHGGVDPQEMDEAISEFRYSND
jgi:Type IV secretory pathway, VirB11 components, and related ATPases involved in archaeal flagella biosynthesis